MRGDIIRRWVLPFEPGCVIQFPDCEVVQPLYAQALKCRFALDRPGRFPLRKTAQGGRERVDQIQPRDSRTEDVLLFRDFALGRCAVRNPRTGIEFVLSWDRDVFPYFWCWQVYGGSWGYPYYGQSYSGSRTIQLPDHDAGRCRNKQRGRHACRGSDNPYGARSSYRRSSYGKGLNALWISIADDLQGPRRACWHCLPGRRETSPACRPLPMACG